MPDYRLIHDEYALDEIKFMDFISNDMHKKNLMEIYMRENNPVKSLTRHFLYHYLNMTFYFASKQNDYQFNIDTETPGNIYNILKNNLDEDPLIKLKYLKIKVSVGNDINDIKELEDLLEHHHKRIPGVDMMNAYASIITTYNRMTLAGNPGYRKNSLEVYKKLLEYDLLTQEGYFLAVPFNNIVLLCYLLRETDFLRNFIDKYKDSLKENERETLVNFGLACLNFCTKNYVEVLKYLNKVEFISFYQKLHQRMVYIHLFYELNDEELFTSHLNSARRFLDIDTSMAEIRKKRFIDFIQYAGIAYKTKNLLPVNKNKVSKMIEDVERNMQIEYKDWLLEKLEELK